MLDLDKLLGRKRTGGELVNVRCDEVSLVGKPAIRKKILLYKSESGADLSHLSDQELLAAHRALHERENTMRKSVVADGSAFPKLRTDPCPVCGAIVEGSDRFCAGCGASLNENARQEYGVTKSDCQTILKAAGADDPAAGMEVLIAKAGTDGETLAAVMDLALDGGIGVEEIIKAMSPDQQAAYNTHSSLRGHGANPYARAKASAEQRHDAAVAKSGEVPAWRELEKLAGEIAAREGIKKESAIVKAAEENPDVYRRYLVETAG